MIEQLIDTIQGLIAYGLPTNAAGVPVVYDREIKGWYIGDTDISGAKDPSILFVPQPPGVNKDIAFGTKELEHKLTIKFFVQAADVAKGDRTILELTREIYEALLPHRLIWVLTPCPICLSKIFSPQHYTIVHESLFATYITNITNEFNAMWATTHPNTISPPALNASGLAAQAFLDLMQDVENNVSISGLPTQALQNIQKMISIGTRPIRLMYDVALTDVKPSDSGVGKQNLHGGEFTLVAKELLKQSAFGPDNVPTDTYAFENNDQ